MGADVKCLFGLHKLEVYKEQPLVDPRGNEIGFVIVSKCANCGKIVTKNVYTVDINSYSKSY